jgi:hypothetical protein
MIRAMTMNLDQAIPTIKEYPDYDILTNGVVHDVLCDILIGMKTFGDVLFNDESIDKLFNETGIAADGKTAWYTDEVIIRIWVVE